MRNVLLIARRELAAYVRTMSGYVIIAVLLLLNGVFFHAFAMAGGGKRSSEVLAEFFWYTGGFTMVCAILLSMRLLAEERQTGTITLLFSSPVRDGEIVLGKFLSALGFLSIFQLATLYMPALIWAYGKVSLGHLAVGYLGLFLLGAATLAVGILGSSFTKSQVLAAILGGAMAVFLLVAWLLARVTERPLSVVFENLAMFEKHFNPFRVGLLHVKHVVYFGLVSYLSLFAATRVVEARRWR
jgi:ABC-2 type transport system permease protein